MPSKQATPREIKLNDLIFFIDIPPLESLDA